MQKGINTKRDLMQNSFARKEANLTVCKKFLGDVSYRAIQFYLNRIINDIGLEVVDLNVYINGIQMK